MKSRRVGTISMGIALIAFGVLIFFAQFNKMSALRLAINIWPGVLILLGGEILWTNYRDKDENTRLRYDIFSIFIVFVIVISSVVLYGMMEIGALEYIQSKVSERNYSYELPLEEYVVDENIERIIVDGDKIATLNIRSDTGNKILSTGNLDITSDSQERADTIFGESKVNIEKLNNTLYVSYKGYRYYGTSLNLVVPSHIDVEVSNGNTIDVIMDRIGGNWVIDGGNKMKMRLKKDANVKVQAIGNEQHYLSGNVDWKDTVTGTDEDNHTNGGELTYGEGMYKLNILNVGEVVVDEI